MINNDLIKRGIEHHTGRTVDSLEVFPDPKVDGAYAIRAQTSWTPTRKGSKMRHAQADFLICANHATGILNTPERIVDVLEDCAYETWPPTVGALKFF